MNTHCTGFPNCPQSWREIVKAWLIDSTGSLLYELTIVHQQFYIQIQTHPHFRLTWSLKWGWVWICLFCLGSLRLKLELLVFAKNIDMRHLKCICTRWLDKDLKLCDALWKLAILSLKREVVSLTAMVEKNHSSQLTPFLSEVNFYCKVLGEQTIKDRYFLSFGSLPLLVFKPFQVSLSSSGKEVQ